ncbi:MAG: leucyl/phenylalanyl-tRNA--protein transferase [Edaphocola sp.]
MIFRLAPNDAAMPHPSLAEEDGLLAIGGNLSQQRLLTAYGYGIFPWYNDDTPILWYAPPQRCVIFPGKINISKSMRRLLRKGSFTVTKNKAFERVIQHCASIPRHHQDGTWITEEMRAAYMSLHESGHAHSIEVWQGETLTGGLYGVVHNNVFCGESMFSLLPNASKTALIHLCTQENYRLIDCQMPNPHLMSMGAEMIGRDEFLNILQEGQ